MELRQLHLQLSQAEKALQYAKSNHYSDISKQKYQEQLIELFEKTKAIVNARSPLGNECFKYKVYIDFIFQNIVFLNSSTLNRIPYEIVVCLEHALKEWMDEEYIITISLINEINSFSFDNSLITTYDSLYGLIKKMFQFDLNHRLIQINIPKAYSKDYLVSAVHYHELGHFIDGKNKITEALAQTFFEDVENNNFESESPLVRDEITQYFDYIYDEDYSDDYKIMLLKKHFAEYFCDLFASQYVGRYLSNYLMYITENEVSWVETHPSAVNRQMLVDVFLNKQSNFIIKRINEALLLYYHKELEIRFEEVAADDFYNLLPVEIENQKQLHGLISTGWKIWNDGLDTFQEKTQITDLTELRFHTIINNLIEKSIRNFNITETWKQSQSKQGF